MWSLVRRYPYWCDRRICGDGESKLGQLQRGHDISGVGGTVCGTVWMLPRSGVGRQDLSHKREPPVLQRVRHSDERSEAGAATEASRQGAEEN